MTIERPMFPPRAESVDSFPLQPAIGQPDSQTLISESPSPFEDAPKTATIFKFPYSASRRVYSKKSRTSKNGSPGERAAKAAAGPLASVEGAATNSHPGQKERRHRPKRVLTGEDWDEFVRIVGPDLQQEFMIEAWKLINRFGRKL